MPDRVALVFLSFRRAFSGGTEVSILAAILLLLVVCLWLIWPRRPRRVYIEEKQRLPDQAFFDMVVSQKGLEEADKQALVRLGERCGIVPLYGLLLRKNAFQDGLDRLRVLAEADGDAESAADVKRLEAVKDRVFPV